MNISEACAAEGHWDALVIGAGPAGSVAARALAQAGRRVLLVERSGFPRSKVCGCCLSPAGVRALRRVGLDSAISGTAGVNRCTIRVRGASARLPAPGYRVIGRDVLDARLAAAARDAGAMLMHGWSARVEPDGSVHIHQGASGTSEARPAWRVCPRLIVVADGLGGTSLSERPEFAWRVSRRSRMGVGARLAWAPMRMPEGEVLLVCGREGYIGFVRLPTGDIDAAAALDPASVRGAGGPGALCADIVARCGGDPRSLDDAAWRGTPLLTRRRGCVEAGNVFVLGDAAAYVEPFTGEGMTWAIEGALVAARVADEWLGGRARGGAWAAVHRQGVRAHHRRCAIVANVVRRERVMRVALGCAAGYPAVGRWLAGMLGPAGLDGGEGAPA